MGAQRPVPERLLCAASCQPPTANGKPFCLLRKGYSSKMRGTVGSCPVCCVSGVCEERR
jgi:hypothetical protein